MRNLVAYGVVSTSVFLYTVLHAFRERSNFYSAAVYLSKSNACMMILWNQGIYQTVLFGKFLQMVFFGHLRILEVERLQERGWFAITETLLALTIFKDEFDSSFVILFVSLLFLKVFHWLAADRVELMEQAAHVPSLFHLRMGALLSSLWLVDALLLTFAIESILLEGPTVMIMFASEYMILLAMVWSTTMKYGINVVDLRTEVPWEEKSIYVFYVDLATDFFKLVTYLSFFGLILTFYGLPLNILRDVYVTFRSFILKCRDLKRYREATRNMDSLYPDASADEMARMVDKTCIICREDMEFRGAPGVEGGEGVGAAAGAEGEAAPPPPVPPPANAAPVPRAGPNDTPKKLPCGHVFHFHCLRSWLERQQSCPTCRRPVLASEQQRAAPAANRPPPAGREGANEEAIRQAQVNFARNLGRDAFGVVFPGIPFPAEAAGPAPPLPAAGNPAPEEIDGVPPPPGNTGEPALNVAGGPTRPVRPVRGSQDNPLARFALPELKLPPAGEASLYNAPAPTPGYASIGYGTSATTALRTTNATQPTYPGSPAQATRLPNLDERLAHIRARMSQGMSTVPPSLARLPTDPNSAIPIPSTSTTAASTSSAPPTTPSSSASASDPVTASPSLDASSRPSSREAMLAAAERRAQASRANGLPNLKPTPTTKVEGAAPAVNDVPSPVVTVNEVLGAAAKLDVATSLPTTPVPSTSTDGVAASSSPGLPQPTSTIPHRIPRLIPLFNPAYPVASTVYPNLLSSMPPALAGPPSGNTPRHLSAQPLLPDSPSEEQLQELSQLTRRGIEERLRILVGFQDRMAALAHDMTTVLNVLPVEADQGKGSATSEAAEINAEVKQEKKGKGKGRALAEGEAGDDPLAT